MMTCSAVSAISLIRCDETKTVRPWPPGPLSRFLIQWMPSGSRPLTGSSRIKVAGSPSSAAAMPSRWPIPSENVPDRLPATSVSPVIAITSSTRRREMPVVAASASRWSRALRPLCTAFASSSAPTSRSGAACAAYRRPLTVTRAGRGRVQPENHPDGGRLARPVRPKEPGHHPGPDGKAQIVNRGLIAIPFGKALCLDHVKPHLRRKLCGGLEPGDTGECAARPASSGCARGPVRSPEPHARQRHANARRPQEPTPGAAGRHLRSTDYSSGPIRQPQPQLSGLAARPGALARPGSGRPRARSLAARLDAAPISRRTSPARPICHIRTGRCSRWRPGGSSRLMDGSIHQAREDEWAHSSAGCCSWRRLYVAFAGLKKRLLATGGVVLTDRRGRPPRPPSWGMRSIPGSRREAVAALASCSCPSSYRRPTWSMALSG